MNSSLRNIMNSWEPCQWNELSRYEAVHQVWLVFSSIFPPQLTRRSCVSSAQLCFMLLIVFTSPSPSLGKTRTKETSCSVTRNWSSSNTFAFERRGKNNNRPNNKELGLYELIYVACVSWRSSEIIWRQTAFRVCVCWAFTKLQLEMKPMQFVNMSGSIPSLNNIA